MGRALLYIILGLISVFGLTEITLHNRESMMLDQVIDYFRDSQVRNYADSGIELSLVQLAGDALWDDGIDDETIGNGDVSVTVSNYQTNSTLAANVIQLMSVATYHGQTDTVYAKVTISGGIPPVPSPMGIYSNNLNFNVSGNSFVVDGNDTNPDGSAGTGDALPGISVGGSSAYSNVTGSLSSSQADNITGEGGTPSVAQDTGLTYSALDSYVQQYVDNYDQLITGTSTLNNQVLGTTDDPQITVIDGDISISSTTGAGILVVENGGSLRITGSFTFTGLIILLGDTTFEADIYGNTHIYGSILFGATDPAATFDLDLRGNVNINYSSQAIDGLNLSLLDQVGSTMSTVSYYE